MKFTLSWLKDHLETDATLDRYIADLEGDAEVSGSAVAEALGSEEHPPVLVAELGAHPTCEGGAAPAEIHHDVEDSSASGPNELGLRAAELADASLEFDDSRVRRDEELTRLVREIESAFAATGCPRP